MKIHNKIIKGVAAIMASATVVVGCTDDIALGNSFIEKAPGGTVTIDTVFNSAEYTRQFLTAIYALQYYGLPYSSNRTPNSQFMYAGKVDALTDCYQIHWNGTDIYNSYYSGTLTANGNPLFTYNKDNVWEAVRQAYILIENIERVPDMDETEKKSLAAQARCLIAARYFDLFVHYGGLPLVEGAFTGQEATIEAPRATFENTVDFMVGLLDQAISDLRWAWDGNTTSTDAYNNTGRWTKAGAMALKAKILLIAASPLYNADKPYYDGTTQAETDKLVWYGNYDAARWQRALNACNEFFAENGESDPTSATLGQNGKFYQLNWPTGNTPEARRQAYRMGYIYEGSKEVIHSTRVATVYGTQASYGWWNWVGIGRNSYNPTEEYVEMFPWSSGEPFDWDKDMKKGNIDGEKGKLFYQYTAIRGGFRKTASRDPRLYENAIVNGQPSTLDWSSGIASGNIYELWVGGADAGYSVMSVDNNGKTSVVEQLTTRYADGYGVIKYYLGEEYHRKFMHWVYLSYDEMMLMWAECLAQTGNLNAALNCVNRVRARVGLGKMETYNSALRTDKDQLIEEILRERACELGMSNNRYYDMCRYKRGDWMTKQLHGLAIYRMQQNAQGQWVRKYGQWIGNDKDSGQREPNRFEYEIFPLQNRERVQWGKDPESTEIKKWFLWPFPIGEINKNYGLVQNPGW
ncbi:MAG: RagB/SusD family nutrient uptake outer membrane protein [Prevotella sp.]|nr:RagB/SusD family nutrient uptake outer membrane protein [Prevotella sp.]